VAYPLPAAPADPGEDDGFHAATEIVRDETAEALEAAWEGGDIDPLLATLERLRLQ
jgi:hypothetical protein